MSTSMISASTSTCGRATSSCSITARRVLKPSLLAWITSALVAGSAVTLMPSVSPTTAARIAWAPPSPPRGPPELPDSIDESVCARSSASACCR